MTYLRTREGFMYLSLLTDKGSRKIVGYPCGESLETEGCLEALEMALADCPPVVGRSTIRIEGRSIAAANM